MLFRIIPGNSAGRACLVICELVSRHKCAALAQRTNDELDTPCLLMNVLSINHCVNQNRGNANDWQRNYVNMYISPLLPRGEEARVGEENNDHESRSVSSRRCVIHVQERGPQRTSRACVRVGGRWRHRTPGGGTAHGDGLFGRPFGERRRKNCWPFGLAIESAVPPTRKKSPHRLIDISRVSDILML